MQLVYYISMQLVYYISMQFLFHFYASVLHFYAAYFISSFYYISMPYNIRHTFMRGLYPRAK